MILNLSVLLTGVETLSSDVEGGKPVALTAEPGPGTSTCIGTCFHLPMPFLIFAKHPGLWQRFCHQQQKTQNRPRRAKLRSLEQSWTGQQDAKASQRGIVLGDVRTGIFS